MKDRVFRPHLDDVERLSYGKGAKKQRGTGSRSVCHRLNQEERKLWELAKEAGFLTVRGTGYRKERKGSPLGNIFRQRCDALKKICVVIEKRSDEDILVIDLSTLRVPNDAPFVAALLENVFKEKYPDLHRVIEDSHASLETASNDIRRRLLKTSVATPIDWEIVKSKPIWEVDPRQITVGCSRDIAKAVAIDVLEESKRFDLSVVSSVDKSEERRTPVNRERDETKLMTDINETEDDDRSIDWDDI